MSQSLSPRCHLVAAVALFLLSVTGCSPGYGPKVQHGNIEVFYTAGATKAEADRLGAYLVKAWGAQPGKRSVQIKKTPDGYQFRMVVRKEFQNDTKTLKQLEFDAARISREVFDGAAVEVHACDEMLKTLMTFPPRSDVRYSVVEGKAEVFYPAAAAKEDAEKLAKHLGRELAGVPELVSFKLAQRGAIIEVHMVVQRDKLKDPTVLADLRQARKDIADNVFKGSTVEMHLCDELLNVIQVLKPS